MIDTDKLFKEKKFPKWFQTHPIFKDVKTIKKVFPGLGLPNCEQELEIDNGNSAKRAAKSLISTIKTNLSNRIEPLTEYINAPKFDAARRAHGERCIELIKAVKNALRNKENVIHKDNGRISLKLPADITLDKETKPIFRKNESLIRVYNKLNQLLRERHFAALPRMEDAPSFKTFSAENIPNKKFKVVFSSDGVDGAWDIGTMSCRGISSCQSWTTGKYKHCTIGSVIDPFVGIIYMTSGANHNQYGTKMLRRCIVRFAIDKRTSTPFLLIDRMYPSYDKATLDTFISLLKKRVGDKIDVHYSEDCGYELINNAYLPLNQVRDKLKHITPEGKKLAQSNDYDYYDTIQSYQDNKLPDKVGGTKDKQAELFEKNSNRKIGSFQNAFSQAFAAAAHSIDVDKLSRNVQDPIKKLTGKDKYENYSWILKNLGHSIAGDIVNNIDKKAFTNSDTYIRRVFYAYYNNKRAILDKTKAEHIKYLNGTMHLKPGSRFGIRAFNALMESVYPALDQAMKPELHKLVEKRKFSGALPLP